MKRVQVVVFVHCFDTLNYLGSQKTEAPGSWKAVVHAREEENIPYTCMVNEVTDSPNAYGGSIMPFPRDL